MSKSDTIKIKCSNCGGRTTNHQILQKHEDKWIEEVDKTFSFYGGGVYQICQCLGCENLIFRSATWHSEDTNHIGEPNTIVRVYPDFDGGKRVLHPFQYVPLTIQAIYAETVSSINHGNKILAGGGLRAIVEAICNDQGIEKKIRLVEKIDELKERRFLTPSQADLLHEERFIGNKALHDLDKSSEEDLYDGLDIIEGLLKTIYDLPKKAERLKKARAKSKTKN